MSAEILVAEFAGELPPNVAAAVRKHVSGCAICGPRAQELRASYDLVGSLGAEPVAAPPDLRERVYIRTQTVPLARQRKRLALAFPRAAWGVVIGGLALAVIAVLVTQWLIAPARTQAATRSTNALTNVPPAGAGGEMLAATSTLISVRDQSGRAWRVAEVVAADERTGAITRSLPASDMPAEASDPTTLPVAIRVTADNATIVELTAPDGQQRQALVAFGAQNGAVRFISPLALPAGATAVSLALSPTEPLAFVGLRGAQPTTGPRALVVDLRSGAIVRTLTPSFNPTAPLATAPPAAGQAPARANSRGSSDAHSCGHTKPNGGALADSNAVHQCQWLAGSAGGAWRHRALTGWEMALRRLHRRRPTGRALCGDTPYRDRDRAEPARDRAGR